MDSLNAIKDAVTQEQALWDAFKAAHDRWRLTRNERDLDEANKCMKAFEAVFTGEE